MKITLKDGSSKEYSESMSIIDIAKDISEGLARMACAATVNGKTVDLRTVIEEDCDLNILTFNDDSVSEFVVYFRKSRGHRSENYDFLIFILLCCYSSKFIKEIL